MANITKTIDRAIPSHQRYVVFTDQEIDSGDVIRVVDTLGRSADTLTIECDAGCDLSIRVNSRITVYPNKQYPEENQFPQAQYGYQNLSDAREFDSGLDLIKVGDAVSDITYTLNDVAISDLEVTFTVSGFNILLS